MRRFSAHGFSLHTADKRLPFHLPMEFVPTRISRTSPSDQRKPHYHLPSLISRQLLPYHFSLIVLNDVLSTWYEINRFTALITELALIGEQLSPDLQ